MTDFGIVNRRYSRLMKDCQWHNIDEIKETLNKPIKIIEDVLFFYGLFDFVEFDRTQKKVIIDQKVSELFQST